MVYIFEGRGTKKDKFRLVLIKSLKFLSNQAKYKFDDIVMMKGMRVKITFTSSATETCAPLFVTVTGLKKRNLYRNFSLLI